MKQMRPREIKNTTFYEANETKRNKEHNVL